LNKKRKKNDDFVLLREKSARNDRKQILR
jgi:hypothetical protein